MPYNHSLQGFFHVLSCFFEAGCGFDFISFWIFLFALLSYCCVWLNLSVIVVVSLGKSRLLCFSLMYNIVCVILHSLFTLPFGVIGRLCSVIVVLQEHLLYNSDHALCYVYTYLWLLPIPIISIFRAIYFILSRCSYNLHPTALCHRLIFEPYLKCSLFLHTCW